MLLAHATGMVHFRTRLDAAGLAEINERITGRADVAGQRSSEADEEDNDDGEHGDSPSGTGNAGALLMDASCASADIRYPTVLSLLNEAREKLEAIITVMHGPDVGVRRKPRSYAERARLRLLDRRAYRNLLVCAEVYRQQSELHHRERRSIPGRIVSISQPHVRPIVRGKAGTPVEFGAKMSVSKVDGFTYLDRLGWEPYHEASDLVPRIEAFHRRFGCYPESVHVDAIYRTRENRRFCKEHGIRMSGPPLGRPKNNPSREEIRQTREDERARIPIEGAIGRSKRAFSLARIMAKRADTSQTAIAIAFIVMNLDTLLARASYALLQILAFALLPPTRIHSSQSYLAISAA